MPAIQGKVVPAQSLASELLEERAGSSRRDMPQELVRNWRRPLAPRFSLSSLVANSQKWEPWNVLDRMA